MSCLDNINPSWCKLTVDRKTSNEALNIFYSTEYYNTLDPTLSASYEYIVVSGTPSDTLDANGRKEISAGDSLTDSRLYGGYVVKEVKKVGSFVTQQYITQTDDDTAKTTTITITDGSQWGEGDIIVLTYR